MAGMAGAVEAADEAASGGSAVWGGVQVLVSMRSDDRNPAVSLSARSELASSKNDGRNYIGGRGGEGAKSGSGLDPSPAEAGTWLGVENISVEAEAEDKGDGGVGGYCRMVQGMVQARSEPSFRSTSHDWPCLCQSS